MPLRPVPFSEPWHVTALRTGSLALAVGVGTGVYKRQLPLVPLVTVLALWFTLGGHYLELAFRNQLSTRIGSHPWRTIARLAYWFAAGSVLYVGARATFASLTGRSLRAWPWWAAGVGFIAAELGIHLLVRARKLDSFYNGLG